MTNETSLKHYSKVILAGLALALSASFLSPLASTVPLTPAHAAGGCGDAGGFGCGSDAGTGGGSGPALGGGGGGTTPPKQGGDTGGGAPGVPDDTWKVVYGNGSSCPVRDDGKAAIRTDYYYKKQLALGFSETEGPVGFGGSFSHYVAGEGYYWESWIYQAPRVCRYPPRTYLTTATCVIKSDGSVDMVAPNRKNLARATSYSGYTQGSRDYNSCVTSKSMARPTAKIVEYGKYTSTAVSTVQTATVEISISPDETTGVTPGPRIVGLTPPYQLAPKTATASSDCAVPFATPARNVIDFTEAPCAEGRTAHPTFQCVQPLVRFDQSDGRGSQVGTHPNNSMQFMRDGDPKFLRFNQSVTGTGIAVSGYKTTFLRSGTPWNSSRMYNNNDFELSLTEKGSTILTQSGGSRTQTFDGRVNEVFHRAYSAGVSGAPTQLTQKIDWTGTRRVTTATITGIDGRTGLMTWVSSTANVPTSGACNQTATLEYIRAIGDAVR